MVQPAVRPLWERPVSYAAVGATQAADLMVYPPAGFRPFERRARIGHGDIRWEHASSAVLSWAIQRRSGFRVEQTETPVEVTEHSYVPVSFDAGGVPIAGPAAAESRPAVGPDGSRHLAPGDTALLGIPFWPFHLAAPVRVVYTIDEPRRRGFAYGTIAGHPESGEESFVVYRTDDGSVWLEIRAFSRPSHPLWWAIYPVLRASQWFYTRRYFRALSGPIQ
ncbi:MAG TPA: DUF1990 domain-containing protein [Lacisediminihabitans sp.]|uniref:DUF1990 family protein n=1 Tax=Lacisediminihabitans sp. TaxID=2787631 RepID=UPI002ED998E7